ncbi:MAG: SDR family NAD(P)-dependent oxidoreductase [Pseudomonadota bacterium]
MQMFKNVLITGANAGLGRETARQLAEQPQIEKIYLACRNAEKAEAAQNALASQTRRDIFEVLILDVADPTSVRQAVLKIKTPLDAVVLNAGGSGGKSPNELTKDGVTTIFAANVLGHTVLVEELLARQLITSTVVYSSSEAARGIPRMGVAKPEIKEASLDEFAAIADGSKFGPTADPLAVYGTIKLVGTLWMASMARKHPHVRFVSMSPGGTTGTNGMDDLPFFKKLMFKHIGGSIMPLFGMMHSVETGARRYLDALENLSFKSGHFYASDKGSPTGPVVDQLTIDPAFTELSNNLSAQDNAYGAIQQFV